MTKTIKSLLNKVTTKHLLVLSILFVIYIFARQYYRISTEPAFTIGKIYKIDNRSYRYHANYIYYYEGNAYTSFMTVPRTIKIGEVVIVKFSKKYPNESDIECEYIVNDSIFPNGQVWEEIPKNIVKKRMLTNL